MDRRSFLKTSALAATVAASGFAATPSRRTGGRKPNILLLFSDQHKADVMGCAGHPFVKTPHLDRLATEGVRFTRAYCPDGICVPSRTSMFTGLYPSTTGVIYNSDRPPYPDRLHPLHSLLRANGYLTGCFGKRHFPRGLNETDWDMSATTINPRLDPSDSNYYDWVTQRGQYDSHVRDFQGSHKADLMAHISNTSPENRTTAYLADRSIEFLQKAGREDRPFFCWSSFIYPHQPYTPLKRWADLYDLDKVELPGNLSEPVEHLPQRMREWRTRTTPPWDCGTAAQNHTIYRRYIAYYYALMSEVDHHIGRILSALKALNLDDNTIVIYASDHGDFVAAHGMVEKCAVGHNVYEDTLRVPLIFHWPGKFEQDITCDGLTGLIDFYPTLLELTGISRPTGGYTLPGRSLAPVLTGKSIPDRPYLISENWSQVAVIDQRYKLGKWITPPPKYASWNWGKNHPGMLFDRKTDPLEVNNLIDKPEMESVQNRLQQYLAEWQAATPDDAKQVLFKSPAGA